MGQIITQGYRSAAQILTQGYIGSGLFTSLVIARQSGSSDGSRGTGGKG